jgi:hypothetical protein
MTCYTWHIRDCSQIMSSIFGEVWTPPLVSNCEQLAYPPSPPLSAKSAFGYPSVFPSFRHFLTRKISIYIYFKQKKPLLVIHSGSNREKLLAHATYPPLSVIVSICLTTLPPPLCQLCQHLLDPPPPLVSECQHFSNPHPPLVADKIYEWSIVFQRSFHKRSLTDWLI